MFDFSPIYSRRLKAAAVFFGKLIFSLKPFLLIALFAGFLGASATARAANFSPLVIDQAGGAEHVFQVELALTAKQRQQGLMYRTELADDKGMLFIFPNIEKRSFWMRNVPISLDIIFLRKNGSILNIVANAEPQTDTGRPSIGPAKAVLELAGGRAAELGLQTGDIVRHILLGNMPPK